MRTCTLAAALLALAVAVHALAPPAVMAPQPGMPADLMMPVTASSSSSAFAGGVTTLPSRVCPGGKAPGDVCRAAAANQPCQGDAVLDYNCRCPSVNPLREAGYVCRGAKGPCDQEELCDGRTLVCPRDVFAPAGTQCPATLTGVAPSGFPAPVCKVFGKCDGRSALRSACKTQDWCSCYTGWGQGDPKTSLCFNEAFANSRSSEINSLADQTGQFDCQQAGWVVPPRNDFPLRGLNTTIKVNRNELGQAGYASCALTKRVAVMNFQCAKGSIVANAVRTNIYWSPVAVKTYISCDRPTTCNPTGKFYQTETGYFTARPAGLDPMCRCPNGQTPWIMVDANMAQKCSKAVQAVNPDPLLITDTQTVVPINTNVQVQGVQTVSDAFTDTIVAPQVDPNAALANAAAQTAAIINGLLGLGK